MDVRTLDVDALAGLLRARGWLPAGVGVAWASPAGDGNMNVVLRLGLTDGTTRVLKQSLPYVRKYPQIAAPADRIEVEIAWYAAVSAHPAVARRVPAVLGAEVRSRLLLLADLGDAGDCTDVYAGAHLSERELADVLAWTAALHAIEVDPVPPVLRNREMRALNHAHLCVVPFTPGNGLDLDAITPGLGAVAADVIADAALLRRVRAVGDRYLADGPCLLHGDLYPGSLLRIPRGVAVLDPEFGFLGDPAVDRGVLLGHLVLSDHPEARVAQALDGAPPGTRAFAGVEILRRLLGVAQLPLSADLSRKRAWIAQARTWLEA